MEDTIAAISTALGIGAISIIRVSGTFAIQIVNSITKYKKIDKVASHTINYDYIVDNDKIVDEVLISVMHTPKTFTKEDIVEINCHGGISTTNKILELLLINGCRLAEPGEFTKRAFLNGRIDLIEAESIMDLINSKTEKSRSLALNQLQGTVSNEIKSIRQEILSLLANIEVNIDYPEYEDITLITTENIKEKIDLFEQKLNKIFKKSEDGKIVKNGINVSIIGRPNVGKSSLLNCLLESNKAIVTDIEGTTRDCVEGQIILNGIILNIIDTAGIRKTNDIVESIGVAKSIELIEQSDLILFLLNNNEKITDEDYEILNKIKDKIHIIVINKSDLKQNLEIDEIKDKNIIYISAANNDGIEKLKSKIIEIYNLESIETEDLTYLTSARSLALLNQALSSIQDIKKGIVLNVPVDLLEIDLKKTWNLLGSITGEVYEDELIDQLFSQFCLGK